MSSPIDEAILRTKSICRPEVLYRLLALIGQRLWVLNAPGLEESEAVHRSGDVDCAVEGLDRSWPIRLPDGWRLCQRLQYNVAGCYWVLEKDGDVVAVDTLADPDGMGPDAFPTTIVTSSDGAPTPAQRGAYLTAKRLRKGIRAAEEWERIAMLAGEEPEAYLEALGAVLGTRMGRSIGVAVLDGRFPNPRMWRRARTVQVVRRFRSPKRILIASVLGARRVLERASRPSGLFVLLVGPDGSGKSTLSACIPGACHKLFRRAACFHSRPGVLPRPGWLLGRKKADASQPHAQEPHGRVASSALLAYHWLDFLLAGWLRVRPLRIRTGLVVVERGWWDLGVDQRRYRLDVPVQLVRALGKLLPQPDLILMLEAPAETLVSRKPELPEDELERQMALWPSMLPKGVQGLALDASAPPQEMALQAREAIVELLERRAVARLAPGWTGLPRRFQPRWWIPRGPRRTSLRALSVYQPVTGRTWMCWELARCLALTGIFRLLPGSPVPPRSVRQVLSPHLPPGGTWAVARANHPGRFLALLLDQSGACTAVAKVAEDEIGRGALSREAAALSGLGSLLSWPLKAPRILAQGDGLLLLEALVWHPRLRAGILPEEVARGLGAFFGSRACATKDGPVGPCHGDCAPWNLLRTSDGWALVDWEEALAEAPILFDLFHYVVQSHVLLGYPSCQAIVKGLGGGGWIGRAIIAYAEAAGFEASQAEAAFPRYLRLSEARLDLSTGEGRAGLKARRQLLGAVGYAP